MSLPIGPMPPQLQRIWQTWSRTAYVLREAQDGMSYPANWGKEASDALIYSRSQHEEHVDIKTRQEWGK